MPFIHSSGFPGHPCMNNKPDLHPISHRCLWVSSIIVDKQITIFLAAQGFQRVSIVLFSCISTNSAEAHSSLYVYWMSEITHFLSLLNKSLFDADNYLPSVSNRCLISRPYCCFIPVIKSHAVAEPPGLPPGYSRCTHASLYGTWNSNFVFTFYKRKIFGYREVKVCP